ncbi:hypothetical protein [uncultured Campylobacter sp.]|nr:hypothetical protein [uncultured Campylobacter sp.]
MRIAKENEKFDEVFARLKKSLRANKKANMSLIFCVLHLKMGGFV